MTLIIQHRQNTVAELANTPRHWGVEVDVRSWGAELVLAHGPFVAGEFFADWLRAYDHSYLIVNVKEEGLENACCDLLARFNVSAFFFLDQSFPFLVKTAAAGEPRCAVRVSEYESVATAMALAGRIDWVWVDCFTRFPLSRPDADRLHAAGFKLCLVSPELQARSTDEIQALRSQLRELGIAPDAVCTKVPREWT